MSTNAHISGFSLTQKLIDNGFTQAWTARDEGSGDACFLKFPSAEPTVSKEIIAGTLRDAFDTQQLIRHRGFLTAFSTTETDQGSALIYPFRDPDKWQPLRRRLEGMTPEAILSALSAAGWLTDFLHLRRVVHRDLKLSNFLSLSSSHDRVMVMSDLDLLCRAGRESDSRIMGTPGFIAPEVRNDRSFSIRADVYSLGCSIEDWFASHFDGRGDVPTALQDFREAVTDLSATQPMDRPEFVLDHLFRKGQLSSDFYNRAVKRLLSALFISSLRAGAYLSSGRLIRILQDDCGVCGLSDEFLEDLQHTAENRPERLGPVLSYLVKVCRVEKQGPFFNVKMADDDALAAYELAGFSIKYVSSAKSGERSITSLESPDDFKRLLALKDHLGGDAIVDSGNIAPENSDEYHKLAMLLEQAGRSREAINILVRLAESDETGAERLLELTHDICRLWQALNEAEKCRKWLKRGYELSDQVGTAGDRASLAIDEVWVLMAEGDRAAALSLLNDVNAAANSSGDIAIVARCDYQRAALAWREGKYSQAIKHVKRALPLARESENQVLVSRINLALQLLHMETAEFQKSIRYSRDWRSTTPPSARRSVEHYSLTSLVACHVVLGNFHKMHFWLNQMRQSVQSAGGSTALRTYLTIKGWGLINEGAMREGEEHLYRAIESSDHPESDFDVGKAYQNLAEVALISGNTEGIKELVKRGRSVFQRLGSESSTAEIDSLQYISEFNDSDRRSVQPLVQAYHRLTGFAAWSFAVSTLFHILLAEPDKAIVSALRSLELERRLGKSQAPLFKAANYLLATVDSKESDRSSRLAALKHALAVLDQVGNRFRCMLLCERIGQLYAAEMKSRLATKFLSLARTHAKAIGHADMIRRLDSQLAELGESSPDRSKVVKAMATVAEIFREQDYEGALQRMLQFSIEELGAERAVLLVHNDRTVRYEVRTAVHCDEGTLVDVSGLSSRLSDYVQDSDGILRINDALNDNRTKSLQSVVLNNIRSVLAIPITSRSGVRAILYLDHHTVPALFDAIDARYLDSLAEFVAASLDSLEAHRVTSAKIHQLTEDTRRDGLSTTFVTQSEPMQRMLEQLPQIAQAEIPVLIIGETGTGKGVIARLLHSLSKRATKQFVAIDCATLQESLIEAELFGIGAKVATGVAERIGKFEYADGGTLFIDEVGNMPLSVQAKILRCVEEFRFQRVGQNRSVSFDARFIYATNRDLSKMVEAGTFRDDLLYRISTMELELLPLRNRPEDIGVLTTHFLTKMFTGPGRVPMFSDEAKAAMARYEWPGNVRELENLIRSVLTFHTGGRITLDQLPPRLKGAAESSPAERPHSTQPLGDSERQRVLDALNRQNWNRSAAARDLGMPITTFRRRMKKYQLG